MTRALACLLLCLAVAGCGVGAGEEDGGATLTVTRDFGFERVGRAEQDSLPSGETVMRLLQRDFDVTTRYGGQFVKEINGVAGGREEGRRVDWFYYVNGIEADVGAASRRLSADDRVWWDHHDWGTAMRIPAVVGSFPEPFLSGAEGKRLPIRIDCAPDARRACDEVAKRLEDAGVTKTAQAAIGQPVGAEVARLIVGRWTDVRRDGGARQIERGPGASGVFARFDRAGRRLELLDARGRVARALGAGAGLVAATRYLDQQPTWIVTGTDDVGVAAAAAGLQEQLLRDRFAVAIDEGRGIRLPIAPAGAPAP
jgi:hypothetical protein